MNKLNLSLSIIHNQMNVNFHLFSFFFPLLLSTLFLVRNGEREWIRINKIREIFSHLLGATFLPSCSFLFLFLFYFRSVKESWVYKFFKNFPIFPSFSFMNSSSNIKLAWILWCLSFTLSWVEVSFMVSKLLIFMDFWSFKIQKSFVLEYFWVEISLKINFYWLRYLYKLDVFVVNYSKFWNI